MNLVEKIKQLQGLKLYLTVLITIPLYYLSKSVFINTEIFQNIELYYARFIVFVLNALLDGYTIDATQHAIVFGKNVYFFSHVLVTKYYLLSALILFLFPRSFKKTVWIYLFTSILFLCLTTIRLLIFNIFPADLASFFLDLIISLRYLILYKLLDYKLHLFDSTKLLLSKWNTKINTTFVFSLNGLMMLIVFIRALIGLFDWFLVAKWNVFVIYLTKFILALSNGILWLLGYAEAYTWGKFLILKNYWLFMDTNCLGVGLMVVFCLLIAAIRSPLANKILFIGAGLLAIVLMNAIRLVTILLYIYLNQTPAALIKDYHDLSNNVFYVVVFLIILFYINWFQFVNFRNKKIRQ